MIIMIDDEVTIRKAIFCEASITSSMKSHEAQKGIHCLSYQDPAHQASNPPQGSQKHL